MDVNAGRVGLLDMSEVSGGGPGPVRPAPANIRALADAEMRSMAVPVYRALVAAHEQQPPREMTYAELRDASGLFTVVDVIEAVSWMRRHGVLIFVQPSVVAGEPAVVALSARLPEAFEPTGPDR